MIDPEVARLRRLRGEALRVRAIARALGAARWATNDTFLSRGACASWRVARIVSGKLKAHPYLRYQKDASAGVHVRNRLAAWYLALVCKDRIHALKEYESRLCALVRQLEDTRALAWSSDFSDSLGRAVYDISSLLDDLGPVTQSAATRQRLPVRAPRGEQLVDNLGSAIPGDWPYLAF
jgi:hypothetical protein